MKDHCNLSILSMKFEDKMGNNATHARGNEMLILKMGELF